MTRAMPSASGAGHRGEHRKLAATPPSSQPNAGSFRAAAVPNQKPPTALPMPHTASSRPPTLSGSCSTYAVAYAGTATPPPPNANAEAGDAVTSSGGEAGDPQRAEPLGVGVVRGCGATTAMARPRATTSGAEQGDAGGGAERDRRRRRQHEAQRDQQRAEPRRRPRTAPSRPRGRCAHRHVRRSAVSAFQAPRTAAVSGGYVAPATPAAPKITGSGAVAGAATSSSPTSASGWATPVTSSTGAGPTRSASRPATGLSAAPASA